MRIDGDTATGTWWIRELLVPLDGPPRETIGRYDDEYASATDEGWRLASRAFTPCGSLSVRPAPAAT